jgi:hypothetical protein
VIVFVSGSRRSLLVYLVHDLDSSQPQLTLQGQIPGLYRFNDELTRNIGPELLAHEDGFGLPQEDPIYGPDGNSLRDKHDNSRVRFFLHRVEVHDDGLQVLAPVSTPGEVIAWRGERIFTLDNGYSDAGDPLVILRRSDLRESYAYIEQSLELGTSFLDARLLGDHLWTLRGEGDGCEPDGFSELFSVDVEAETLEAGMALQLPGWNWRFPHEGALGEDGGLIVAGGPLHAGRLEVDIDEPRTPKLVRYRAR